MRGRFTGLHALLLLLAGVVATMGIAATGDTPRRKARHYYMQGVEAQVGGHNDRAFEYYKKAYETDPSYEEAASAYGSQRMMLTIDSLQTMPQYLLALRLMQPFVDSYPGDFYESQYYAYLAANFDTLPEAIRIYQRADSLFPRKTSILPMLAEAYMAGGQLDSALAALEKFERAEGPSVRLSLTKVGYIMTQRDTARALQEAERLVALNPRSAEYLLAQSNVVGTLISPDSAYRYMRLAEEADPGNGSVKIALASYYLHKGDSAAYDEKVYEALLSEDFSLETKTALMADYLQVLFADKQDTRRGDYLFKTLENQYPHEPAILDLSGRYSAAKGDFKSAAEALSYAIDLEPDNEGYRMQMMSYLAADSLYDEALRLYDETATRMKPPTEMTTFMSAVALWNKDYQRALGALQGLISEMNPELMLTQPATDKAYRNSLSFEEATELSNYFASAGDIYASMEEMDSCFAAYDNALFFYSHNAMALNNYAYFLTESGGDLERAERMSSMALAEDSQNPTFLDTYAWVLFYLKRYEEALSYQAQAVEEALKQEDESSELYDHYGDILFMNHEPERALEYWEKALKLDPDNELIGKKVKNKTFFFKDRGSNADNPPTP